MKTSVTPGRTHLRVSAIVRRCAVTAVLALAVSACAPSHELNTAGTREMDVNKLHPIGAEMRRASLDVALVQADTAAESDTYFSVTTFVRQYLRDGRGKLEISTPWRQAQGGPRNRSAAIIRNVLQAHGVTGERVRYSDRRDGQRMSTLSYFKIAAIAPTHCDDWSEDVTRRMEMGPYRNFGCATQRNLANMVADPTDLVTPAVEVDRGSERMAATYKSYSSSGPSGGAGGAGAQTPAAGR